ncbi:hypothetical protein RvY_07905 [Ramazzottius varieornatus]|uniref:HTH psq-type domain-containing protein n=1 Tax=Ramazzottius varieornatus TaxID=947166 RepID=A0A1D1V3Y0_RAMVA|nr:hypothetical protein RvY_07905 [Ramazzottius varieornatus]
MDPSCPSRTPTTSEGNPSVPVHLPSTEKFWKRQYVQAHPNMEAAINAVKDGMSIRMAAEMYHIPHRTLGNEVNGEHGKKVGRPNTFTLEEESEICEIIVRCSKIGVPLGKRNLIRIVKEIALAKEKSKEKAKGLRNQKRNIEAVEESATDSEDENLSNQGYPCQAPPKRQRKTAKQVAAEIASDVPAPQSNIESSVEIPEGYPSKTKAKRATARARTTPAPRKKPSATASKAKAKMLPLPKAKPRVSAKSKAKKT